MSASPTSPVVVGPASAAAAAVVAAAAGEAPATPAPGAISDAIAHVAGASAEWAARATHSEPPTVYTAFACSAPHADIKEWTYHPLPLGPLDVEIKIQACGVCHSDLHQVHNDWGVGNYPMVVGHEIVGEVIAVGREVTKLVVGQRVGVGPQTGACGKCRECTRGEPQHCPKKIKSYNTATGELSQPFTYGGFAHHIRTNSEWAFPIPDALTSAAAAPLLCAGITTWTPFVHNEVKAGQRVGVIGMGGLGHVALQFSVALGCHTTSISTSADKEADAKKFGAQSFLNASDAKAMAAAKGTFDFLLCTISANGVNWDQYFDLLLPDGTICIVGLPTNMAFNPKAIVQNRLKLVGSYLASNTEIRKMLEFCAKHNIKALIEELDMNAENANRALKKVEDNTARYRMVLVNRAAAAPPAAAKAE